MRCCSTVTFIVSMKERGLKLLSFLRNHCPKTVSTKAIKRAIDAKKCRVNGRIQIISTFSINARDRVEIDLIIEQKIAPVVLFEDDDLLVVSKPPYLICDSTQINAQFPDYRGKLLPIHRLDKETSGVLLLAKNGPFKEKMITLFRKRGVKKIYHAIVDGEVKKQEGTCESLFVKKRERSGQVVWGSSQKGEGKEALTVWKRLKVGRGASYLEIQPITGRTHQIRVHMSEMGHPILGDVQYEGRGRHTPFLPKRNLLHAMSIEFIHPMTENRVYFKAPLPQDFKEALAALFD